MHLYTFVLAMLLKAVTMFNQQVHEQDGVVFVVVVKFRATLTTPPSYCINVWDQPITNHIQHHLLGETNSCYTGQEAHSSLYEIQKLQESA
jgi:hypothetical protein